MEDECCGSVKTLGCSMAKKGNSHSAEKDNYCNTKEVGAYANDVTKHIGELINERGVGGEGVWQGSDKWGQRPHPLMSCAGKMIQRQFPGIWLSRVVGS
jgi:hypothetical protein